MEHVLQGAQIILRRLMAKGYQTYLVGGAVRDLLLGRLVEDIDIVTNADPKTIESLFDTTVAVGKEFGVIVVVIDGIQYHVSTFRGDRHSKDHRHPESIFWADAQEDAKRRDFTINGLLATAKLIEDYQKKGEMRTSEIVDFVDGQRDIASKVVRFIGKSRQRIQEDALRILRAVRFKNILGFEYEFETKHALIACSSDVSQISSERIRDELNKMLADPSRVSSLRDLDQLGILGLIIPDLIKLKGIAQPWKFHGEGDVFTHTLLAVEKLPAKASLLVVWGTLLHDIGKPDTQGLVPDRKYGGERIGFYGHHTIGAQIARVILERLRFARDDIEHVSWLVENHMMIHEILEMRQGRQRRWLLDPRLPDLLELHRADASGKGEGRHINLGAYEKVKKLREEELAKPPPPPKVIDGNDVMKEFRLKPGPEVGRLLKMVEDAVWDGAVKTRVEALQYLKKSVATKTK